MSGNRFAVLQNLYNSLMQDRKEENKRLNENLSRVKEIDSFLKSVKVDPESDVRVFSPRTSESMNREKIKECENEKITIEKENHSHYERIEKLNKQIEDLKVLLQDVKDNDTEHEENILCEEKSSELNMKESIINENSERFVNDDTSMKENNKSENSGEVTDRSRNLWIFDIQEKERQRIARELHDSSVQNLTHLIHTIELSSMFIDQDPIRAKLELASCSKNLRAVIDEMREIIFNLRPMSFDDLGFEQSIQDYITNIKHKFGTDCEIVYNICEIDKNICDKDEEHFNLILVTVYRLIQETLTNSLKYSDADKVVLNVSCTDKVFCISIKDNGKGFSLEQVAEHKDRHFGLSVMKERVYLLDGEILIETEPGMGTEIKIEIPLR